MTTTRGRGEHGAALVEFAIVAVLVFTILFGIIEFGWAFSQNLDVRHGAREASRLIAVNYRPVSTATPAEQADDIIDEVCTRMDGGTGTTVTLTLTTAGVAGDRAQVEVTRGLQTLTGFFDGFLGGKQLTSEVETRIEVDATWGGGSGGVTRTKLCGS